jgi:hypothetical protein
MTMRSSFGENLRAMSVKINEADDVKESVIASMVLPVIKGKLQQT